MGCRGRGENIKDPVRLFIMDYEGGTVSTVLSCYEFKHPGISRPTSRVLTGYVLFHDINMKVFKDTRRIQGTGFNKSIEIEMMIVV
jgi:hypothetical protein